MHRFQTWSNFAYNVNPRRYTKEADEEVARLIDSEVEPDARMRAAGPRAWQKMLKMSFNAS